MAGFSSSRVWSGWFVPSAILACVAVFFLWFNSGTGATADETLTTTGTLDVDVVGLRLGMTPDAVLAALTAHNPNLRVTRVSTDINMRDSHRQNVTLATYEGEIRADWQPGVNGYQRNDPKETISVLFASPPAEPRAIQIRRRIQYIPRQGPAFGGVVAAINGKYGDATHDNDSDQSILRLWQYDGWRLAYGLFTRWYLDLNLYGEVARMGTRNFGSVDAGRSLGVLVTRQGDSAYVMNFVLSEGLETVQAMNEETNRMANTALDAHEAKLRGEARQLDAPPPL